MYSVLNEDKLNIIESIQNFKSFKMSERRMLRDISTYDWCKDVEDYYYSIPREILYKAGLKANKRDLERVLKYKLTDEILNTNIDELNKFEF